METHISRKTKITILGVIAIAAILWVGLKIFGVQHDELTEYDYTMDKKSEYCNIAVLPIVGYIIPYEGADQGEDGNELLPSTNPDDVLTMLRSIKNDEDILGVLVRIDSGGGAPVASEIISNALKNYSLPVIAQIREVGVSGGYLIATGAEKIVASPFSDVGSIGITMSYLENSAKNAKEGLQYVSLTSGKFKDYGSRDKPLTVQERELIERDLQAYHSHFIELVAKNRNMSIEEVTKLADGSSMSGSLALKRNLIDMLGDQESTRSLFAQYLKLAPSKIVFCE